MSDALIGYTGFVGATLSKQRSFEYKYRSTNIEEIQNKIFETLVCSAAPAQKWIANREPEADLKNIQNLINHLKTVQCKLFILISTVDVFQNPNGVTEEVIPNEVGLNPYGLHRRYLEKFVEEHFENYLIVRLSGLVGPGLRKNVIFDFLNNNNVDVIDSRGRFQFYPMVNLWSDIQIALKAGLKIVHLTSEPISVQQVAELGFNKEFKNELEKPVAAYDFQTRFSRLFEGAEKYQYSVRETLLAIRAYAQSEPSK